MGAPTLLFWNEFWGRVNQPQPGSATLVFDRSAIGRADAVVFHLPTLDPHDLPPRRPGQLWVGWSMESPVNCELFGDPAFMARFDLTTSYERTSDVWTPYLAGTWFPKLRDPLVGRDPVVWLASNPHDRCGRVAYAAEVMESVPVDSFGAVLHNQAGSIPPGASSRLELYRRYKFTLAFENSVAPDYVTEKFYEPLAAGSVPVYRGTKDVVELAPAEHCYIDAADFSSGRELGRYLDHLDRDEDAYLAYHEWRKSGPSLRFTGYQEELGDDWIDRLASAVAERLGGPQSGPVRVLPDLPGEPVVEVDTVAGPLLLFEHDRAITPVLRRNRVWESLETEFLTTVLSAGQTFVDLGAHVGYFTVLAAERVGPDGRVIALEPEPRNRALLEENVAAHHLDNVVVLPYAAHREPAVMTLEVHQGNRGAHRLVEDGSGALEVRCVRPDDVLPERVDVVKIDVQGFDHDAVAGLAATIGANPQIVILTEVSVQELAARGLEPADVLAGYEAMGLELAVFDGSAEPRPMRAGAIAAALEGRPPPFDRTVVLRPADGPVRPAAGPSRAPWLLVNETEDGLIVLSLDGRRLHHLNPAASVLFTLCDGELSPVELAAALRDTYGLAAAPESEVAAGLAALAAEGLVV